MKAVKPKEVWRGWIVQDVITGQAMHNVIHLTKKTAIGICRSFGRGSTKVVEFECAAVLPKRKGNK